MINKNYISKLKELGFEYLETNSYGVMKTYSFQAQNKKSLVLIEDFGNDYDYFYNYQRVSSFNKLLKIIK